MKSHYLLPALILMTAAGARAELAFTAPNAGATLTSSAVLRGSCDGSKNVSLSGPGIDSGKKISCQKNGSKRYWEYSLKNAFKKMSNGNVVIKIAQGSANASRSFIKGAATNPPPPPPPPTTTPQPPVAGLDPAKAPAANFDLSLWKITLPVDSSGGFSGSAIEVKSIGAAYQKAPYFHTGADGGMVFMAPVEGATTSGSKYPRSELREMTASGGLAAWTAAQGGSLSATLAVNEVPMTSAGARGRVVIGQIHGPDDELCRLYYDNGRLYFYDDKAGSGLKETQFILKSNSGAETNIPLNAKFDYSILVTPTMMTVSAVHSGVVYSASEMLSSFWPGKSLYYKAGVYVQVGKAGSGAGTTGSGKGQTTFYRLTRPSHN